jgi:hypothetical protein
VENANQEIRGIADYGLRIADWAPAAKSRICLLERLLKRFGAHTGRATFVPGFEVSLCSLAMFRGFLAIRPDAG